MSDDQKKEPSTGDEGDNNQDRTIVTGQQPGPNTKDDCSDLTDANNAHDEQAPKSFPQKLMEILSEEDSVEIISWLPHGNGFIIHKKKTFAAEILPRYFKASKFTSFTRKLNRWGFTRVPRGPETGAYFHKLFRRDDPTMCTQMTSNSGNKYQANPLQQQLLPNMAGMMNMGGAAGMGMFPYMPNPMMASMTPQQQQAMWQQQMIQMQMMQMQMQHMQQQQNMGPPPHMQMGMAPPQQQPPQMQQQQQQQPPPAASEAGDDDDKDGEDLDKGDPVEPPTPGGDSMTPNAISDV